jgi:putative tricarboxylic transport membrane protein
MFAGLMSALAFNNLLYLFSGSVLGLLIGAAPGLGPVFGLALFLSMTFSMPPAGAIIFMASFYAACVYGGSITAILLNAPGTPGSVATCFDGYAFTRRGEAGRALGISTMASFAGGITGVLALFFLGPPLAVASLAIGPPEFFMLAAAGLFLVALATKGNTIKGLMMSGLGLMLSFVGRSVVTGEKRFDFGTLYLEDGVQFVPVVIGVFAFAQAMVLANETGVISEIRSKVSGVWQGCMDVLRRPVSLIRNACMGTLIGILPGLGINAANFICYVTEKSLSKNPDAFGTGVVEGIIAPEAANNGSTTGSLVPAFGLGVPGSASAALFLSALMIHGLQPGHGFFTRADNLFSTIIWGMLFAQVAFLVLGLIGARYFAKVTLVPNSLLVPMIMVLCFVGALSYRGIFLDVLVMLVAGGAGYYLQKHRYPLACLILGMILGPLAEDNFCRSMLLSRYSLKIFVTRPISLILLLCIVVAFVWGPLKQLIRKKRAARSAG